MENYIQNRIEKHYRGMNSDSLTKLDFYEALVIFLENNFLPDAEEKYTSLFCSIHDHFPEGHNCVGCNLNENNERIENFLLGYKLFYDINSTYPAYIMLLYMQAEYFFEYFKILQIPDNYLLKNFQILYTIKRWANFLKHPKTFLLCHHSKWNYDVVGSDLSPYKDKPIINSEFVNKYYAGDKNNKELFKILYKQEDLLVLFPNPKELTERFCEAQKKFKELIVENRLVRDILNDNATIKEHFEEEHE